MRKKLNKKLTLNRETLYFLGHVAGAATDETVCGYTCLRQCQPVYTVDGCATNPVGGCASGGMGCPSGYQGCPSNQTYPTVCPEGC